MNEKEKNYSDVEVLTGKIMARNPKFKRNS